MYSALALVCVAVVAGVVLTRPERLAWITAGILERATGAEVAIERAYLSLDGGLDLVGVRFAVAGLPGELGRLGEVRTVRVTPNLWALGRGRLQLRSIVLMEPTLFFTRDPEDDRYNYQHLLRRPRTGPRQQWLWEALPEVFIRHGTFRFAELGADGLAAPVASMGMDGRLTRDPDEPAVYRFTLRQEGEELLPGVVFHGSLDLLRQRVSTELHGFQFTEVQQHLLPGELRELWRRLDPSGEMPVLTFSYDRAVDGGLDAELRVQDVALNVLLPGMPGEVSRMHGVSAVFRLRGDRVDIEELRGEVEGIRYRIDGEVEGLDLDARMRLRLVTEPFEIMDASPVYLRELPRVLRRQFERFEPRGWFQTAFEVWRDEPGGELKYDGLVRVLDAQGRYERLPVRLRNVHGLVRVTHEQVEILEMHAQGVHGGEVVVEGTIAPPKRDAAVDIRVSVRSGVVDDELVAALEPKHRRVVEMFLHEGRLAELVEADVVRERAWMPWHWRERVLARMRGREADAMHPEGVPMFTLGGRVHAAVHVTRVAGPGEPMRARIELEPDGPVRLLFEHWAYPLAMVGGRVVIEPDVVEVDHVRVVGLTGAEGTLAGYVYRDAGESGADIVPDLRIVNARLPIDDLLLTSIPTPQDRWIRQFGLAGELTATGEVVDDAEGETDFALAFSIAGGEARPFGGEYALSELAGQVVLRRDGATLKSVTARRGETRFAGRGVLGWGGDAEPSIDVVLRGESLTLEREVLSLLPADHPGRVRALALLDQHQLGGQFDVDLVVGAEAGPEATPLAGDMPPYRLVVHPRSLSLVGNDGQAVAFRDLAGRIVVAGGQAELEELTARFDAGHLSLQGPVMLDASAGAALQLTGELERLDGPWVGLLPERLRETLRTLDVRGRVALAHGRLLLRPQATDGLVLEVAGQLDVKDAQLNAELPIEELTGQLHFELARHAYEPAPRVDLRFEAEHLLAQDRVIAPLTVHVTGDPQTGTLNIDKLQGSLYQGVLVGTGMIGMQPPGPFHLELALQDVHVEPFVAAPDLRAAAQADELPAAPAGHGRLNLSFTLQGEMGDTASRRGRGAMEVHNARLYERPVTLALLQAVSLSLPLSDSFDRGSARFLVEGDTIYFDDLALEAPSLTIRGTGTMHYPTGGLDFQLRARNPAGPNLGVISDMLNLVKDQLMGIRITGTMDQPRARVVSLEDLSRPWTDAFNPRSDR